ncbi:hypothetical protein LDENG_00110790 [Lucifuga dentata]|nr:hypothetical protein LDENG_00110790 [Lucifuga dentata]
MRTDEAPVGAEEGFTVQVLFYTHTHTHTHTHTTEKEIKKEKHADPKIFLVLCFLFVKCEISSIHVDFTLNMFDNFIIDLLLFLSAFPSGVTTANHLPPSNPILCLLFSHTN